MVERRKPGPAHRRGLAGWLENGEQRRKQGDRGQERDDHAGSGDQPEFGQAHIGGRQERVESGCDRGRRKQKRARHAESGRFESLEEIAVREPLGAVSDAELDAEIDAKADEQHGEGDRDEVQRADHRQADSGGETQADREIDQDGENDPGLLEGQPQDQENDDDGHHSVERRAVGDGGKFLVRQGHRAGEAHFDAPVGRQAQFGDRRPDGLGRLASGLQIAVIEDGLDVDEPPEIRRLRRAPRNQPAPGESRMLALLDLLQSLSDGGDRRLDVFECRLFEPNAFERLRNGAEDPAQGRIEGERSEERLRLDQLIHVVTQVIDAEKQDAIAGEEFAAVRPADGVDHVCASRPAP